MSLFQAREWWSFTPDQDQNQDPDSPQATSIVLDSFATVTGGQSDVLVTGSLSGVLRLLSPFVDEDQTTDGTRTWSAANLLLESQLAGPILQVATGNLSSSGLVLSQSVNVLSTYSFTRRSSDPKILVLHPRLVSVYNVAVQRGKSQESDGFQLQLQYQHKLSRSAHCALVGNFGRGKKDFICVQSLDGTINFFEQESYAFSRFLPDFLLPGPIAYNDRTDSLITVSSSYQLESFRYQALAVAGEQPRSKATDDISSGKKLSPDWKLGLGEATSDIQVISSGKRDFPSTIVCICSKLIWAVHDTGTVIFMKKLDYIPISCHVFKSSRDKKGSY